jgi:hypothetical protein
MLIRNPAEFEHKAREWSVKHAGAPKKEIAEGSGGATAESIKKKHQQAKENEEKVKLAAYVAVWFRVWDSLTFAGTTATTRNSSTASWPWDLMSSQWLLRLSMSVLIRWAARTMSWRRHTWVILPPVCLARLEEMD